MKKLFFLLAFLLCITLTYAQLTPGHIYGAAGSYGLTFSHDPIAGTGDYIAPNGSFGPVTELQFDPTGTFLYGGTGGGFSSLITIDPNTGIETLIGTHTYGALNGLEFVGDVLYGTFFDGSDTTWLVIVDPLTANLTPIGLSLTGGAITGLAYNEYKGIMYGMMHTFEDIPPSTLVTIDLVTGIITPVGLVTISNDCRGLTFGPNGVLYTGTTDLDPSYPGHLISLDPKTGMGTIVGPTVSIVISGLAYPSALGVPISNWAIVIGVILIGAFIVFRFRRRLT